MRFVTFSVGEADSMEDRLVDMEKWIAIVEIVIVTFLVSFIPDMIKMGRPPATWLECWEPILSAMLMSLYAYIRVRGLAVKKNNED